MLNNKSLATVFAARKYAPISISCTENRINMKLVLGFALPLGTYAGFVSRNTWNMKWMQFHYNFHVSASRGREGERESEERIKILNFSFIANASSNGRIFNFESFTNETGNKRQTNNFLGSITCFGVLWPGPLFFLNKYL